MEAFFIFRQGSGKNEDLDKGLKRGFFVFFGINMSGN